MTVNLPGKEWDYQVLQAMIGAMRWPRGDVELIALRPEFPGDPNQDYDAQYNEANFREYSGGHFRRITMRVRKQTFAEYIREKPPGTPHAFLALDCSYYLRREVEQLHEEDLARREQPGEEPRMSAVDSFIYASAVFPSLPGEYKLPWSSGSLVVENTRGVVQVPVKGWWGMVVAHFQYVHNEPRTDSTKLLGCLLLVLLTCCLDWSPTVTAVSLIYFMRVSILQHLIPEDQWEPTDRTEQRITQTMTGAGKSYCHENNYVDN